MASPKLARATASFAATEGGVEYFIREGEVVPATHPVVKAHPELFTPEVPVEQR